MKQEEPRSNNANPPVQNGDESVDKKHGKDQHPKKKKFNTWPLKAMLITFGLSFVVNAGSELVLEGAQLWLAILLTAVIVAIGVLFDVVATASTSCDVQPFLAMASRKVKGAKMAVKIAKKGDVVSSICGDIVGDICGIVSGVCAAAIANNVIASVATQGADFWVSVGVCAVVSTATITLKAVGKGYAVNNANSVVFFVARFLSIFVKEG